MIWIIIYLSIMLITQTILTYWRGYVDDVGEAIELLAWSILWPLLLFLLAVSPITRKIYKWIRQRHNEVQGRR